MIKSVGFTGIQQLTDLREAIKHQEPARLVRSAHIGMFDGITSEELAHPEIKAEIVKAKAKQIFDGGKKAYDTAITVIKKRMGIK